VIVIDYVYRVSHSRFSFFNRIDCNKEQRLVANNVGTLILVMLFIENIENDFLLPFELVQILT